MIAVIDQQLLQRTAIGLCALLATVFCASFLYTLTAWHADWQLTHRSIQPRAAISHDQTTDLISSLPSMHLFGQSGEDMPITSLQLRVTGIVKSNDENGNESSKAYISIEGQPSKIYQIGDSMPYGVKVYAIDTDSVILENDGRLEKLPLPRDPLIFKPVNTEGEE